MPEPQAQKPPEWGAIPPPRARAAAAPRAGRRERKTAREGNKGTLARAGG